MFSGICCGALIHASDTEGRGGIVPMEDTLSALWAGAIFQVAIFHGIAAVMRTVGRNKILIVLSPALTLLGLLVFALVEEGVDYAFRFGLPVESKRFS